MIIPEEILRSAEFSRRLVQMAHRLLSQTKFPKRRYDNDIEALVEDIVQQTLTRLVELPEPDEPIKSWSVYCYTIMYFVVWEEHRDVWRSHEAKREKTWGMVEGKTVDLPAAADEIVDRSLRIDQQLELLEEEQLTKDRQERIKRMVDVHLWDIIREEVGNITDDPTFFAFVELRWNQSYSGNTAWETIKDRNPTRERATFFRWFENRLRPEVMKRWIALVQASGGIHEDGKQKAHPGK